MTVRFDVYFLELFLGRGEECVISVFFNMDIKEEQLLMPAAGVTFYDENKRFLALRV